MNKQYKIVYCTPALYSAGGVERAISCKANFFADVYGYDVTIIVTEGKGRSSFFPLSDKVVVINYELGFESLWHVSLLRKIWIYIQKQFRYKRLLTKDLMRIKPDITLSTLRREINFLPYIDDGSVKIGELHVNRANYRNLGYLGIPGGKRLFSYMWMKSLVGHLKKLDKMVVLTECSRNDWPELDNLIMIPDSLPFKVGETSTLTHKKIISVSRYEYDKGIDMLLMAWSQIEKVMPDWSLDIYGNGDTVPYIHQMQQLGINDSRCHLHGPVSDVKEAYLDSSIFVLPSRYEGFGLVLIEAMACGVPVVSFDCENGPRSIITDGFDGFLVPSFDLRLFVNRILLLMRNEDIRGRMGENAINVACRYDMRKIGKQWKLLFDELVLGNEV